MYTLTEYCISGYFRVEKFSCVKFSCQKIFVVLARPRNFSTRVKMAMYKYQLQWCMRGYHIYKEEWEAAVSEELKCEREKNNAKDAYAVAVVHENVIVGHLPQKISQISALFLKQQGKISCKVLGRCRYSVDLPQGGLEIPFVNFRCLKNVMC